MESVTARVDQQIVETAAENNQFVPHFGGKDFGDVPGKIVQKIIHKFCQPGDSAPGWLFVRVGHRRIVLALLENFRAEMENELATEKGHLEYRTEPFEQCRFTAAIWAQQGQVQSRRPSHPVQGAETFPHSITQAET